jgi:hypothetical protein
MPVLSILDSRTTHARPLQLDRNVVVVQQDTDSSNGADVSDKNTNGARVAHVPRLERQVDSTCKKIGQQEQRKSVAVESVQHLARRVGDSRLLDSLALGAVQFGEHEHLNDAEKQKLRKVERANPADVRAVGHAA